MSEKRRSRTTILQGTLDMLLLRILSPEPLHGYAVSKKLRQVSGERLDIPQGSLYPALHRLEERGWLVAEWTTIRGREAKVYSVTATGKRQLREEVEGWEDLAATISLVLASD